MAEINIERKERTAWPWLLLAGVAVALLLWFLLGRDGDEAATIGVADSAVAGETTGVAPVATATPADGDLPEAASEFVRFAATPAADANLAHEYTADGLRRLADALDAVTANAEVGAVDVSQRVAEIRDRADAMQRNATSGEHALQAREASLLAAALMRQLPGATGGAEAYTAAEAIQADRPLLEQTDAVRRFFEQSATVVRGLAAAPR